MLVAFAFLLALLAAVAIASAGDTPLGSGGARRPADQLRDVVLSLFLVVMLLGAVAFVYLMFLRKDIARLRAMRRLERRGRGLALAAAVFGLLAVAVWWMSKGDWGQAGQPVPPDDRPRGAADGRNAEEVYDPRFALVPVLVLGGLIVVAGAAAYVAYRARRRHLGGDSGLALALGEVLEETLDDLRAEVDPARAVIAAYARLERALAAYGLPRHPAEAPQEYVGRMLEELEVATRAVQRLTSLFVQAKFSQHTVLPAMKEDAIAALEEVRDELAAASQRAAEERAAAVAAAQERAAR